MINLEDSLTFDDVLLKPAFSTIESRNLVDTSVQIKDFVFQHPIIPANMKTIVEASMAYEIYLSGGLALVHRFMPFDEQLQIFSNLNYLYYNSEVFKNTDLREPSYHIGFSVGVKEQDKQNVDRFVEAGVKIFCIDIAHGHSKMCLDMITYIKSKYPDTLLIAGNVATRSGTYHLAYTGADVIKVGVGSGSLCTTRINTGNGVPQMSAIIEARDGLSNFKDKYLISDGGIRSPGDCVKALCFADMVMASNVFAGCDETPGGKRDIDGKFYKEHHGSSTLKEGYIEGVSRLVPCKGPYQDVLTLYLQNIRSGCSYQGVSNVFDLRKSPKFVRLTNSGLIESHPHSEGIRI